MKQRNDFRQKPYYRCLVCQRFRTKCGGRPTRDMDLLSWCEYISDVMDANGLTIAAVANEAEVSEKRIEQIRNLDTKNDIMRSTARRIEQVVLGPVGEHTCYLDTGANAEQVAKLMAELESAREDAAYWRKENDRKAKIIDKYLT